MIINTTSNGDWKFHWDFTPNDIQIRELAPIHKDDMCDWITIQVDIGIAT